MFRQNKKVLLLIVLAFLVLSGIAYEQVSQSATNDKYGPKGLLIDIGSRIIHLDCRGTGSPTIVFESGLDALGSLSWSAVHDELAKHTQACAYDRAGIMWSDKRPETDNLIESIANDLNKTLKAANIAPPYILVGHSYGGPYITKYTELFPSDVEGAVFIDSPHPEQLELVKDIEKPVSAVIQDTFTKTLNPLLVATGITRIVDSYTDYTFPNQTELEAKAAKAFYPSSHLTLSEEIENYSKGLDEVSHMRSFGDRPLYVLANIVNYKVMSDEQLISAGINRELVDAVMEQDLYMFKDQASWSSQGRLKLLHDFTLYTV